MRKGKLKRNTGGPAALVPAVVYTLAAGMFLAVFLMNLRENAAEEQSAGVGLLLICLAAVVLFSLLAMVYWTRLAKKAIPVPEEDSLTLTVFNVGDGDASLITWHRAEKPDVNVLVDTGRGVLLENADPEDPWQVPSAYGTAAEHLKELGAAHLDLLIITHLHQDHMGGMEAVLEAAKVDRLLVPYLPPLPATGFPQKSPAGECHEEENRLAGLLPLWQKMLSFAAENGTRIEVPDAGRELTVADDFLLRAETLSGEDGEGPGGLAGVPSGTREFQNAGGVRMTLLLPGPQAQDAQKKVYDTLCAGGTPEEGEWIAASKLRNPASWMQYIAYAGRSILLCGDRYAKTFENVPMKPVDIVKLPHHGDEKAMTDKLLDRIRPDFAVISCQRYYPEEKDRPNEEIVRMLQNTGTEVCCTENRKIQGLKKSTKRRIIYTIRESGMIAAQTEDER